MTSMAYNAAAGLSTMLKDGHQHLEGVDGATLRNIEAGSGLSSIVRSSLGPNGMNKLVINHLEKMIVTSDCATIVRELEIEHPAARMLSMAASAQDRECGDGTNLVVSTAGVLLENCKDLLRTGLHASEIVAGYRAAGEELERRLPGLAVGAVDPRKREDLLRVVRPVVAAKQFGCERTLAPLVVDACLGVMVNGKEGDSGRPSVSPENVRVAKILGGNVFQSRVVNGMVILRNTETSLKTAKDVKITVFGCGVEASATEAKGTVLMENAEDLQGYNKSEERKMEEIVKSIADTGTKLIVSGGTVSEMALHFMERYGLMCLKISSKWELRRLCAATNSTALVRLGPATEEEMGHCDDVRVEEIGGRKVTVLEQNSADTGRLATVVLRAATSSVLQDLERAVDDGVRCVSVACKDGRVVPGAGATETALSLRISDEADGRPGLDQYAVRAFAKALETVPRVLAENSGRDASETVATLVAAHVGGRTTAGVDVANEDGNGVRDVTGESLKEDEDEVLDLLATKMSAFRLAVDAAITVLRVDQIIMSKQAGVGGKK